jgi:putative ABC transport system permease protein
VLEVGPIGFTRVTIVGREVDPSSPLVESLDISLVGVEPGRPGAPAVQQGQALAGRRVNEAVIELNLALQSGLQVGDIFTVKTVQGPLEAFYTLKVVGLTDRQRYGLAPTAFVPFLTWEEIKPRPADPPAKADPTFNVLAVKLKNAANLAGQAQQLVAQVGNVEYADRRTAYESIPGYRPQQSTLNTQRTFTLLIGLLVIGGFFQIQTLQKVAQVGMLKAIGASNRTIIIAALLQIMLITLFGVALGGLGTLLLALNFPVTIPIIFTPATIATATTALLLIGPVGGLVSIRTLLKVEPLTALGLA